MLELTGMGSVLRSVSVIYWLVAIGALVLAIWKGTKWWGKSIGALLVLAAFGYLPATNWIEASKREAYAREAWAYFKKKCETNAGEKVYKTFTGVKSVLVTRPLPPATDKDHFDQFWYGDPYSASAHSQRGLLEAATLAEPNAPISREKRGHGFAFVEFSEGSGGVTALGTYSKLFYPEGSGRFVSEKLNQSTSRFGVSWEDISTPEDRKYWVAGSRLRITDLREQTVVAERIGYFIEAGFGSTAGQRSPWLASKGSNTTCPESHDWTDRWFVLKVLNPIGEKSNGK